MNESRGKLPDRLAGLVGQPIVLDLTSQYVCLGTLAGGDALYLELAEADVHDLRDTGTTREEYVLTAGRLGVTPNRRRVWVSVRDVVGVSRLGDVIG